MSSRNPAITMIPSAVYISWFDVEPGTVAWVYLAGSALCSAAWSSES